MLEHVWQQQLSPLDLLERAQWVYPEKTAIVHGERRISYRELYAEVQRLAAALAQAGVEKGDRVAMLLPNIPPMLVAHFASAPAGRGPRRRSTSASRPREMAYILDHAGAKVLLFDAELAALVDGDPRRAARRRDLRARRRRGGAASGRTRPDGPDYEAFLADRAGQRAARGASTTRRHDLDQLHLRHDRPAEGRHVPRTRRLPERRSARCWSSGSARRASTSGRCRCSTATAGASPGR